jgi:hypothetical protein
MTYFAKCAIPLTGTRPIEERPKVHIVASSSINDGNGWLIEVDEAVYSFLYGTGKNPFAEYSVIISFGHGGVKRDRFNHNFKAPLDTESLFQHTKFNAFSFSFLTIFKSTFYWLS